MNANIFPHQEEVRRSNILLVAMISPYIWKYISQWIMRRLRRWWESDSLPAGKNLKDLLWSFQARFVLCPFLKKTAKETIEKNIVGHGIQIYQKGLKFLLICWYTHWIKKSVCLLYWYDLISYYNMVYLRIYYSVNSRG